MVYDSMSIPALASRAEKRNRQAIRIGHTCPASAAAGTVRATKKASQIITKTKAVAASTAGYIIEIGARHDRQRPCSRSHPKMGTLSREEMVFPQLGQNDQRGELIESPRGNR